MADDWQRGGNSDGRSGHDGLYVRVSRLEDDLQRLDDSHESTRLGLTALRIDMAERFASLEAHVTNVGWKSAIITSIGTIGAILLLYWKVY
jgi:hypothetical protein